jgi:hypothetical protein
MLKKFTINGSELHVNYTIVNRSAHKLYSGVRTAQQEISNERHRIKNI